jgi:enoyl-CoA hydratase/carnithine racemase
MSELLVERREHIALVTLNRPERMNAISGEMLGRLSEVLVECNTDREVRAVVLTGAGRGFCAGLDLQDAGMGTSNVTGGGIPAINETPPMVMRRVDVPIVCALNGAAAGYGMDMALGCDMIVASERAKFTSPVRRGVLPESGGTWLLPRLVGWHRASEILLRGRTLDAGEMQRLGIANAVVRHETLLDEATAWATDVASNAPLAVAAAKRSMRAGLDSTFEANTQHVMAELMELFRSEDFKEGMRAFLEKRDPTYQGR